MRKILLIVLAIMAAKVCVIAQQYCSTPKFTNVPVYQFTDVQKQSDIVYGVAQNWQANIDSLRLDYYRLKQNVDSSETRPTIILIHGGSFLFGTRGDMQNQAIEYVKRGFNVASLSYRLGWNFGTFGVCNGDTIGLKKAIYRAIQDTRAALRFLVANATSYQIDTNAIFVGGISAGGAMALQTAFVSQADLDRIFPQGRQDLGHIDSSGNSLTQSWKIKAVINMWGALIDTTFNQALPNIPVISFHGTADNTVPFTSGPFNSCTTPIRYPTIYGSSAIHDRLVSAGICSELNYKVGGGHGVYDDAYITGRASCFMKSVLCNVCTGRKHEQRTPSCATGVGLSNPFTENERLNVYPIPAHDVLFLNNHSLQTTATILSLTGAKVMDAVIENHSIQIEQLNPGMYFVQIGNEFTKFVKY